MKLIDTNVFIRYLIGDDAAKQQQPQVFAALLARLLEGARIAARAGSTPVADGDAHGTSGRPAEQNPYLAAAGMFVDDSFAAEVDACIAAQREREREEAAREADA